MVTLPNIKLNFEKIKKVLGISFFIIAIILFFNNLQILGLFFGAVSAFFAKDFFEGVISAFIFTGLMLLGVLVVISWMTQQPVFGIIITNDMMLIIITGIYVILTYFILENTKENFELSRLPILSIKYIPKMEFRFKNESENLLMKNVNAEFEIVYPIPITTLEKVIHYFKRTLGIKNKIDVNIKELMPKDSKSPDLTSFVSQKLNLIKPDLTEVVQGNLRLKSDMNLKFKLILNCDYESQTDYTTPSTIKMEFEYEVVKEGIGRIIGDVNEITIW